VTYKTSFGLDYRIYCTLYIQLLTTGNTLRNYRQYSVVVILHTIKFTVTHALRFSVFTSRVLATDLSQSHCKFKSHVKFSCQSLVPFLSFIGNHLVLSSPELDQILFRLLFCTPSTLSLLLLYSRILLITTLYGLHGKHRRLLPTMSVYWSLT
jgi:hypothetical protein